MAQQPPRWGRGVVLGLAALACLAGCRVPVVRSSLDDAPEPSPSKIASEAPLEAPMQAPPHPPRPPQLQTRTVILTYHDMVEKRDKDSLWFDCTPDELRAQLAWLTDQGAVFVSLADVESAFTGGPPLPDHAVAITFADNYRGFLTHAWPILKEEEIPVTMFVHTGHVGSQKGRPKMTWTELRELEKSGLFHAESQTVSHPPDLRTLSRESLAREFRDSKAALEKELGRPVKYLAYPSGKFNRTAEEEARAAGYTLAFTEEQDPAETAPSRTSVPRYVHTKYREAWREARAARP